MMRRYDNWVNCKEDLLASGYVLNNSQELEHGKLYLDIYIKKGNHVMLLMNYGPNWCDLICWVNDNGKQKFENWRELAGTIPTSYENKRTDLLMIDRDAFMEIVCRYDYEKLEAEFRKIEIEQTLEALP